MIKTAIKIFCHLCQKKKYKYMPGTLLSDFQTIFHSNLLPELWWQLYSTQWSCTRFNNSQIIKWQNWNSNLNHLSSDTLLLIIGLSNSPQYLSSWRTHNTSRKQSIPSKLAAFDKASLRLPLSCFLLNYDEKEEGRFSSFVLWFCSRRKAAGSKICPPDSGLIERQCQCESF